MAGARVLYNTYWIRFAHGDMTFERAVANSKALFAAAAQAGVERIVHVSITNPSADSPLPYFHGKALVEEALKETGVSYAILRPTVLFGTGDILINNIAWLLRRSPVFGIFGDGKYRDAAGAGGRSRRAGGRPGEGAGERGDGRGGAGRRLRMRSWCG